MLRFVDLLTFRGHARSCSALSADLESRDINVARSVSAAPWWWVQHEWSSPGSEILRFLFVEAGNLWEELSTNTLILATLAGFYRSVSDNFRESSNILRIVPAHVCANVCSRR